MISNASLKKVSKHEAALERANKELEQRVRSASETGENPPP